MRVGTCALLVCVWILLANPVAAQPTTEDGIRAVLRVDYQSAARILKPLADDSVRPDPVAQFFLAILYQTGKGVRFDMSRACGLFLRSAAREHAFTEQAAAIAADMRQQLGEGASMMCVADERWRGGPPQSIALGPDHRIVFTDTNVTVVYGDDEARTLWRMPAEAVVPPIQYTPLDVTKPTAVRRHFLQLFQWMPDETANPSSWTLTWALIEVAGEEWTTITWEKSVAEVKGRTPPESHDFTHLARVRVNAGGEAEFTIVGGAQPRTEVIPWQGKR